MENNDHSKLGDHDNCLEKITTKIRRVITKLIHLVSKDLKKLYEILEFCTEQEITFVEIFWSNKILSSLPKTGIFSHQSERSIFLKRHRKNRIVQILIVQSLPDLSVRHHISQSLLRVKLQVRIFQNLLRRNLVLTQTFLTMPQGRQAHLTCLLVNAVKMLNTWSYPLEKSFKLERQKSKEEVLISQENATLVEYRNLPNVCLPKEIKGRSLSAQSHSLQMVSMKI